MSDFDRNKPPFERLGYQQPYGQPGYQQQYGQPGYQQPYGRLMYAVRKVGFVEAYKNYWKNYANFNDRTTRAGYWWVCLWNIMIGFIYIILLALVSVPGFSNGGDSDSMSGVGFGIFFLWALVNFVPQLALEIRRLHDINKRWTNLFFALVPFVGDIILLVFYATETKHLPENRFGHLPQV